MDVECQQRTKGNTYKLAYKHGFYFILFYFWGGVHFLVLVKLKGTKTSTEVGKQSAKLLMKGKDRQNKKGEETEDVYKRWEEDLDQNVVTQK